MKRATGLTALNSIGYTQMKKTQKSLTPHRLRRYSINEIPEAAINAASRYVIDRDPIMGIKKKVVVSVPRMLPIVEIP